MVGTLQPLDKKFAIVDRFGNPTDYFVRWAQQKQIDITGAIQLSDLVAYLDAHKIIAGTGIQFSPGPNGDINQSPTIHADVQAILDEISATRGIIIYRGLLGWAALLPGTAGYFLKTQGPGNDPVWAAAGGGGGGSTPTIRSVTGPSYGVFSSINVPLPAGTVVGDVVVAFAENGYGGTGYTAGWTLLSSDWGQWTNHTMIAKVMTAGDIATGNVNFTFGGSFDGVYGAVCVTGTTIDRISAAKGASSPGSGSFTTMSITGLIGANPTLDLAFGWCCMRGNGTVTLTSGLTQIGHASGGSASIAYFTVNSPMGKLGVSESGTWTAGNNGVAYGLVSFKGP